MIYLSSPTSQNSGTVTPFQVILQLLITAKIEQEEKKLPPHRNSDIGIPIGSANACWQSLHIVDDTPIGIINNGHQQSTCFVDDTISLLPSRNSITDTPIGFISIPPCRVVTSSS